MSWFHEQIGPQLNAWDGGRSGDLGVIARLRRFHIMLFASALRERSLLHTGEPLLIHSEGVFVETKHRNSVSLEVNKALSRWELSRGWILKTPEACEILEEARSWVFARKPTSLIAHIPWLPPGVPSEERPILRNKKVVTRRRRHRKTLADLD